MGWIFELFHECDKCGQKEISMHKTITEKLVEKIEKLEREVVFWKEKALTFKKPKFD